MSASRAAGREQPGRVPAAGPSEALQKKNGIIDVPSHHSVEETVERLKAILESKGITLFALIDHSGEAEKVGMKMLPTKLLIFGSAKAGAPVMLAAPASRLISRFRF